MAFYKTGESFHLLSTVRVTKVDAAAVDFDNLDLL